MIDERLARLLQSLQLQEIALESWGVEMAYDGVVKIDMSFVAFRHRSGRPPVRDAVQQAIERSDIKALPAPR